MGHNEFGMQEWSKIVAKSDWRNVKKCDEKTFISDDWKETFKYQRVERVFILI